MQSQMIGLQSSLDRIFSAIQGQVSPAAQAPSPYAPTISPTSSRDAHSAYLPANGPPRGTVDIFNPRSDSPEPHVRKSFPPLPGFAPPVRKTHFIFNLKQRLMCSNLRYLHSLTNMQRMESFRARLRLRMMNPKIRSRAPPLMRP